MTDPILRCRCGHMRAQHQEKTDADDQQWFSSAPEGSGRQQPQVRCMVPHCECQRFRREPT